MKRLFLILLAVAPVWLSSAQDINPVGAFSRIGFGARGMGMGNALSSVTEGDVPAYYNPALPSFATGRTGFASFGILSLDRYLNVLSYTQSIHPSGGLSLGIINAGVRKIDGRDADGVHTEDYAVTENQFSLAFANRFTPNLSIGVGIKLYYARLYEKITSATVGFDLGACARLTEEISVGVAVRDLASKYKWDTSTLYGLDGRNTTDKFPVLEVFSISYTLPDRSGLVDAEFETSTGLLDVFRIGAEYNLSQHFAVRGGIDGWRKGIADTGPRPSVGFSLKNAFDTLVPCLTYAFVAEPVAPEGMHVISLSLTF